LYAAIKKYGSERFIVETLAEVDIPEELDRYEGLFIAEYKTLAPDGYNLTPGGESGPYGNKFRLNKPLSADHKSALRRALAGNKFSLGKKLTTEHRQKISKAPEVRTQDDPLANDLLDQIRQIEFEIAALFKKKSDVETVLRMRSMMIITKTNVIQFTPRSGPFACLTPA
jgi:hypothetical protein